MTATLDAAAADLQQTIADLQRKLDARTAELHENKERYALVSQAVAEGIYDWDIVTNALWVSPRLIEIFGLTGGSLSAADWNARVHPDDFEHYRTALRDCFKAVTARLHCEYRIQLTNGEYRWVEDHGLPTRDGAGRAVRLVGAVSDITERKEAEQVLREALEQQTATAEVLQVINSSPGDLGPVFDAMLDKAMQLCSAAFGILWTYDGELLHPVAHRGVPPAYAEFLTTERHLSGSDPLTQRFLAGDRFVHLDAINDYYRSGNRYARALADLGGGRSLLSVPLWRNDVLLGFFIVYWRELRGVDDRQITLLENFAAQAAIAIENPRLLGELQQRTGDLQESLEYQTATSDVLKVISRSAFDLQPVLDTLVETATRLCNADGSGIAMREGEVYRYVAMHATYGIDEYFNFMRQRTFKPGRDTTIGRVALEGKTVHIADIAADPEYALPESSSVGKIRTNLGVPLLRDGAVVGMLTLIRQRVGPFTERQVELVQTFADQAVVAIENARLIAETHEALEQQTATAEVLQAINASPGDLTPVFDAILEKAARLCDANLGIFWRHSGGLFHAATVHGPAEFADFLRRNPQRPPAGSDLWRLLHGEDVVYKTDHAEAPSANPTLNDAFLRLGGGRAGVIVALRNDSGVLGAIRIFRQDVRPFTDKQIALLQNFAAQAVIAIENARLIAETQEALAQQTATAEVLQVINASPGDLAPVFEAMLEKATRLCEAETGHLLRFENGEFSRAASAGVPEDFDKLLPLNTPLPRDIHQNSVTYRMAASQSPVHVHDAPIAVCGHAAAWPVRPLATRVASQDTAKSAKTEIWLGD